MNHNLIHPIYASKDTILHTCAVNTTRHDPLLTSGANVNQDLTSIIMGVYQNYNTRDETDSLLCAALTA